MTAPDWGKGKRAGRYEMTPDGLSARLAPPAPAAYAPPLHAPPVHPSSDITVTKSASGVDIEDKKPSKWMIFGFFLLFILVIAAGVYSMYFRYKIVETSLNTNHPGVAVGAIAAPVVGQLISKI